VADLSAGQVRRARAPQVILTVRDSPEKWYQSYRDSLHWMYRTWWFKPFAYALPMGRRLNTIAKWWFTFAFGDDTMADKQRCIDAYHAHNAAIKAAIPADRLLVWDVKQGWAPLCECAPPPRAPRRAREGVPPPACSLHVPGRAPAAPAARAQTRPASPRCMLLHTPWRGLHHKRGPAAARFLGVDAPKEPFPRHNEGVREMAMQIVRFMLRNPIEVLGLRRYQHRGPLTFDVI